MPGLPELAVAKYSSPIDLRTAQTSFQLAGEKLPLARVY
jgi:hypothetical protein